MYPLLDYDESMISLPTGEYMSIEAFENRFGSKEKHDFQYGYLHDHDKATDRWKSIFDDWQAEGVLN